MSTKMPLSFSAAINGQNAVCISVTEQICNWTDFYWNLRLMFSLLNLWGKDLFSFLNTCKLKLLFCAFNNSVIFLFWNYKTDLRLPLCMTCHWHLLLCGISVASLFILYGSFISSILMAFKNSSKKHFQ